MNLELPKSPEMAEIERENEEKELRDAFRLAVAQFGGPDALRSTLGEKSSYLSKITDAMLGTRPVQARWLIPLLNDANARPYIQSYVERKTGTQSKVERADIAEALLTVVLGIPEVWDWLRGLVARRLGVRATEVRP